MKKELNLTNDISRREFVSKLAYTTFGVSLLETPSFAANTNFGKAKHVIYIYCNGGLSHLDSFDPKTKVPSCKSIKTNADFEISEYFPELSKHGDKFSVIRNMTSKSGAHAQAEYAMRTSYSKNSLIVHPTVGAISYNLLGKQHSSIPDNILINGGADHPKAGYFPKRFSPLPIVNPNEGLRFSRSSIENAQFNNRLELLKGIDENFRKIYQTEETKSYSELYDETLKLLKSKDLELFDLNKEDAATRDKYGRGNFGQGLLLARRLIASGVRFVEVGSSQSFDFHNDIVDSMNRTKDTFDKGLAALFDDLTKTGLIEDTVIVIATEFGRTPFYKEDGKFLPYSKNGGRDHAPGAFSCVVGGMNLGGKVIGQTSELGDKVEGESYGVGNLNSTIGALLGIKHDQIWFSPQNRPFKIGNSAEPIKELV